MKAFFLLVLLFLAFILFASSNVSQADLNPYAEQSAGYVPPASDTGLTADTDVVTIQNNNATTAQSNLTVPVTGPATCSNPYTVRSGDILSSIAAVCNTTVASIRLANPQITNANLIYPGQQLVIPGATGVPVAAAPAAADPQVPVTGALQSKDAVTTNQSPEITILPNTQPTPAAQAAIPRTGPGPRMAAGSTIQVKARNFPANTPVSIAVGPQTTGYDVVAASITDATGTVTANISLPAAASDPNTPWVVVVATTGSRTVMGMSQPFYID